LVAAYRMPKSNEKERIERDQAISSKSIEASQVPKDNGFMCYKVYERGMLLKGYSNPSALSDLLIALALAKAGLYGCALNIEANLPAIKDQEVVKELEKAIWQLNHIEEK